MASVYTNDLRLEEIGSGEQSGTWGDTTNTNLELIAEAFSFGTEAITTNADTHTTTIADGATDPGRSIYLKYTGTLDSACTITIGPNTISKLWIIENATSGSQSIIIKQGSGATVTILNGQTKSVYSDGAGSGGAIVDAFQDIAIPDLFVDDDLSLQSDSAVLGFGADNDVTLTHVADTGLLLNGTMAIQFNDASQFINAPSATVLDINATDEIELNATLVDVNANLDVSGTGLVTGVLTTTAQVVQNGGFDSNDASTIIAADGAADNQFALIIKNEEATDDRSYGLYIQAGSTVTDSPLDIFEHTASTRLFRVTGTGNVIVGDNLSLTSDSAVLNIGADNDLKITHDGTNGDFESAGDLRFDVAGDLTIDADGGFINFFDGGTAILSFGNSSTDAVIQGRASDRDLIFKGNDGGSTITALTLDMSDAGTASFNHDVKLASDSAVLSIGADADLKITHDGTNGDFESAGDLTFDVAGDITLDVSGGDVRIKADGTQEMQFKITDGANVDIIATVQDDDIRFRGNDGGSTITALTLDMSDAGTAIFNHDIKLGDNGKAIFGDGSDLQIYHSGSGSNIDDVGTGNFNITTNGAGIFLNKGGSENMASFETDGAVTLYHDNSARVTTTSYGAEVTATDSGVAAVRLRRTDITDSDVDLRTGGGTDGKAFDIHVNQTNRMRIKSNGTIMSVDAGTDNTRFGEDAGAALVSGANNNTLIGHDAGKLIASGTENTFVGAEAGDGNAGQSSNTAVGYRALSANAGNQNVAVGEDAAAALTGENNVIIGRRSAFNATSVDDNVIIGHEAVGTTTATGDDNVIIGRRAGYALTSGARNVCVGNEAGETLSGANDCILIGNNAGSGQVTTANDQLYIARSDASLGNDPVFLYGNNAGELVNGANSSTFSTVSDERIKKNIVDSPKGLAEILQVKIRNFEYRTFDELDDEVKALNNGKGLNVLNKSGVRTGVIAQELETIFPNDVNDLPDGTKNVKIENTQWALIKAVQELSAKNDVLEARIATLEGA